MRFVTPFGKQLKSESDNGAYALEKGDFGLRAVMTSDWSPQVGRALLKEPIAELELNRGKGWRGQDLSFLSDFCELLALRIIGRTAESISPIHELHNLRALHVMSYGKDEIRFGEFPHLIECGLQWRPKATSLFRCTTLRNLLVNGFNAPTTDLFRRLKNLESLAILGSAIKSLEGLTHLTMLRSLRLGDLRLLERLKGIQDLTRLGKLEINTCRKVSSIEEIAPLVNLRELYLDNLGSLQSLEPLKSLHELRCLTFVESTNVTDGNLSMLLHLPNLETVVFQNRKHYSHGREAFGHGKAPPA